jgi:hypothetical protein
MPAKKINVLPIFSIFILTSCGGDDSDSSRSSNDYWTPDSSSYSGKYSGTKLTGSIVSAFQINVDGQTYSDSEDFYTAEVMRLPEKVSAAGYAGWDARFVAVIGFNDLAKNMKVYLSPVDKSGYTGQANVGHDSKFEISLPWDAKDTNYKIRAVKRVNVVISRGGESKTFCYNFSAIEKNVLFSEISKPVVLDTFETKLTAYSCESADSAGGVALPSSNPSLGVSNSQKPTAPAAPPPPPPATISLGEEPASVVEKLGDPDSISRTSYSYFYTPTYDFAWEYHSFPGTSLPTTCTLRFRSQRLVGYDLCPAARIVFHDSISQAADKPNQRVSFRDTEKMVLLKWGLPTRVSRSDNGNELTWDFTHTLLTSSTCTLKFVAGLVSTYSSSCKLGMVSHWTF